MDLVLLRVFGFQTNMGVFLLVRFKEVWILGWDVALALCQVGRRAFGIFGRKMLRLEVKYRGRHNNQQSALGPLGLGFGLGFGIPRNSVLII